MAFELRLLHYMRRLTGNRWGDAVMPHITRLGDYGILWISIGVILLCFRKTRQAAWTMLFALLVESLFCNAFLKPLIHRPRPFEIAPEIRPLIEPPKDRSFPSGHTGSSIAAIMALYLAGSHLWKALLPFALLISWSRLYICVHFVTDILGGIGAGIFSACAGHWIVKKLGSRNP